jgi:hypothetical protein
MIRRAVEHRTKKKIVAGAVAAVLVLAGGGAALAYWTSDGSGKGQARAGTTVAVAVNDESLTVALRPGGPAQALRGSFSNPGEGPVFITSVTASVERVTKAADAPAGTCDTSDYEITQATMPVEAEVGVGTRQGSWSGASLSFVNKPTVDQDGCKGATVTVSYVAA